MAEYVGKITALTLIEDGAYRIDFWVGPELQVDPASALAVIGAGGTAQRREYMMVVRAEDDGYSMEPDPDLHDCMQLLDQHESPTQLSGDVERQWKTAQIADALVTAVIEANILGSWRTSTGEESTEATQARDPENE